jgi:hypothetical protein
VCVSRQIQKTSLNESELLMPTCFRRSAQECHCWLRHIAVKQSRSWHRLLLTVKASPWICWVAREFVCIALRSDGTCRPATPDSYGRLTLHDKTNQPRCFHRCYSNIQTVSMRLHHKLALCLCLCCFCTKDKKGIAVRAVRIFYL